VGKYRDEGIAPCPHDAVLEISCRKTNKGNPSLGAHLVWFVSYHVTIDVIAMQQLAVTCTQVLGMWRVVPYKRALSTDINNVRKSLGCGVLCRTKVLCQQTSTMIDRRRSLSTRCKFTDVITRQL